MIAQLFRLVLLLSLPVGALLVGHAIWSTTRRRLRDAYAIAYPFLCALIIALSLSFFALHVIAVFSFAVLGALCAYSRAHLSGRVSRSERVVLGLMYGAVLTFVGWEHVHPPVAGVALQRPLAGDVVVRQGGVTLLFNHHAHTASQRWALDLDVPMRGQDLMAHATGRPELSSSFGVAVLAPCRATVVGGRQHLADQPIGEARTDAAAGNYLILRCHDTSPRSDVRLAHLRQGSVRVELGDEVHPGQTVAEVGNTGNSSGPHLHIDARAAPVNDGPSGASLPMWIEGRFLRRMDLLAG